MLKGENGMEVIEKRLDQIRPYENNPRNNDDAVPYVMNSIRDFGFKVPIVIDRDGVIVAGHTRFKAANELGMETVPCVVADDLTPEQVRAFRIADNKVAEIATWDDEALDVEIGDLGDYGIDVSEFGFFASKIDWDDVDEITEDNFEGPTEKVVVCPHCGFEGKKEDFTIREVPRDEDIS